VVYPGFILDCLRDFEGLTQYRAVKEISRTYKLPKSTIKYVFRKLVDDGFVIYDDVIEVVSDVTC